MPHSGDRTDRLLIISSGAGSLGPQAAERLRLAFPGYAAEEFDTKRDLSKLAPDSRVIVAGGDGSIGFVVRRLADSGHTLGIVPLGTYNNFARALGIPTTLEAAIRVIKTGRSRAITLGRAGKRTFLEACAIGVFGDAIVLGEAAKDSSFGDLRRHLRQVSEARRFKFKLSGDLEGEGGALSLVCSNTPSTGARLPVGASTPTDRFLELDINVGATRTDLVGRFLASTVLDRHVDEDRGIHLRFRQLRIETRPRMSVIADNAPAGRTPITVRADLGALNVIVPSSSRPPTGSS